MNYRFAEDLKSVRELMELTQSELAEKLDVEQVTISRNESNRSVPSNRLLEKFYDLAFQNGIRLNKLKEMFWRDNLKKNEKLLFHGSKTDIKGEIDVNYGRKNNDFGQGFYTGESYEQSISFVSGYDNSSVYFLKFNDTNLKCRRYEVNTEWMLTIAYYRGTLDLYKESAVIKKIVEDSRNCDYIIAPIADNRMFQIINSFIAGELTDKQCEHCLAATNLGMQYIFISEKAVSKLEIVERGYLSKKEKAYYKKIRAEETKLGDDKVRLAKRQFRGQGNYIDEILGE